MAPEVPIFAVDPDRAQIEAELLRVWNQLEAYADWKPTSHRLPPGMTLPAEHEVLQLWQNLFAEEIDVVRRSRNTIVHGLTAPDEQLQGALDVGKRLWELLEDRVNEIREPKVTEWLFQLHRSGRPWDKRADEVDWAASAVGEPVKFTALQFGVSGWQARTPVVIAAAENLDNPAWTVSRPGDATPVMTGLVGRPLQRGEEFALPITDAVVGNVSRI